MTDCLVKTSRRVGRPRAGFGAVDLGGVSKLGDHLVVVGEIRLAVDVRRSREADCSTCDSLRGRLKGVVSLKSALVAMISLEPSARPQSCLSLRLSRVSWGN
jgi:hypothetical protein